MEIKLFLIIISLQLILNSCYSLKYYQYTINKYSKEVKVSPDNSKYVGFILNITDFKINEKIFFKISMDENETKNNFNSLKFYINFESTFNTNDENLITDYITIKKKTISSLKDSRKIFYFETIKKEESKNYFKFIISSENNLNNEIGFTNTKSDESKEIAKTLLIGLCVSLSFIFLIIVIYIIICCCLSKKKKKQRKINKLKFQLDLKYQMLY